MRTLFAVRQMEYLFSENVVVEETGDVDPNLGTMAKASSFLEDLRLGGSNELIY